MTSSDSDTWLPPLYVQGMKYHTYINVHEALTPAKINKFIIVFKSQEEAGSGEHELHT